MALTYDEIKYELFAGKTIRMENLFGIFQYFLNAVSKNLQTVIKQNLYTTRNYVIGHSTRINNTLNLYLRQIDKLSQEALTSGLNPAACIGKNFWNQLDDDIFKDVFRCFEVKLINGNVMTMEETSDKLNDIVDVVSTFRKNINECGIDIVDHPCSSKILPLVTLLSSQLPNEGSQIINGIFRLTSVLNDDVMKCATEQINLLQKINVEADQIIYCLSDLINKFNVIDRNNI